MTAVTAPAADAAPFEDLAVGPVAAWLLLLRWQVLRQRRQLPLLLLVTVVAGIGVVYGFSFLTPSITPTVATYLSTGAATITVMITGLVVVPQEIAMSRTSGRSDYLSALPVPRLAPMLADVTFWVVVQLPGAVLTLVVAGLKFGVPLHPSALLIPAVALTALTTASVGYAMSVSLPPEATQQITNFLSIGLLLFSPLTFPLSRLPHVLQAVHRVLPVAYMADLVRDGLSGRHDLPVPLGFAVVAAWCAVGLAVSVRAAARRR